jgi:hypothetical protein
LLSHLSLLASTIGAEPELHVPLRTLVSRLSAAVPSFRGLQLTIVHTGQPVTLGHLLPAESDGALLTSLRVPLIAVDADYHPDSRVIFYAGTPGALVDLAADLAYVLKTSMHTTKINHSGPDGDGRAEAGDLQASPSLVLDADVPAPRFASGLFGLSELSAVNRALGVMIDQGHHPDHVYETLRREATAAGVETHVYAARMLSG